MTAVTAKEEARRLIETLPDDATWDDIEYRLYFRQAVEAGLRDSDAGRVVPADEARKRFGLGAS